MTDFCTGCNESPGFIKKAENFFIICETVNFTRGALCPSVNYILHYKNCHVSNNAYITGILKLLTDTFIKGGLASNIKVLDFIYTLS